MHQWAALMNRHCRRWHCIQFSLKVDGQDGLVNGGMESKFTKIEPDTDSSLQQAYIGMIRFGSQM